MNKKVILLSGKARSGKDTVADIISKNCEVERHAFAGILKKYSKEDFGQMTEQINQVLNEFDKKVDLILFADSEEYNEFRKAKAWLKDQLYTFNESQWYDDKNLITRNVLQLYGTEVVRKRMGKETFWVDKVIEEITQSTKELHVITDWRFKNEFNRLSECLVHGVLLNDNYELITARISSNRSIVDQGNKHQSEIDLEDFNFQYIIENNEDLNSLENKVKELMTKL